MHTFSQYLHMIRPIFDDKKLPSKTFGIFVLIKDFFL